MKTSTPSVSPYRVPIFSGQFMLGLYGTLLIALFQIITSGNLQAQDVTNKITPSPAAIYQDFGSAVAVAPQVIVVGAPGDASNKGAAYLYELENGTWMARPKITAPDGANGDKFGTSVAVYNGMLAVGAPGVTSNTGAVYLYLKSGTNWVFAKKLIPPGIPGDLFGASVALVDGVVAVGAPGDNTKGNDAGAVYIFTGASLPAMTQAQKITAIDGVLQDEFGCSVSLEGGNLAVGARYSDVPSTPPTYFANAGAVYIYQQGILPPATTATFNLFTKCTASDRLMNDYMGNSVAFSNGRVIAGAYGRDDNGTNSGASYIFSGATFTTQNKITPTGAAANDNFGWSVGLSNNTAVVGARYKNSAKGAAYIFTQAGGVWTQYGTVLQPTGTSTADQYGYAVSVNSNTVAVGAYRDNLNGVNAGSAYFYQMLAQPQSASATDGVFEQKVQVTWVPFPGTSATSYKVYKYKNGVLLNTFTSATNPLDDFNVDLDTLYTYCVTAVHPIWGESQPVCNIGYKGTIASPAGFTATDDLYEDRVVLNWSNVTTLHNLPCPKCVTGLIQDSILVRKNGGIIDTLPGTATTYTDMNVYSLIEYDYCLQMFYAYYDTVFNPLYPVYDFDTIPGVVTSLNDPLQPYLNILDTIPGNPPSYNVEILDTASTAYVYDTLITRVEVLSSLACDVGSAAIKQPQNLTATYPFFGATLNSDYYEDRVRLKWDAAVLPTIANGYRIYRNGDLLYTIFNPTITIFDDFNAVSGNVYEYCVVAFHVSYGESEAICKDGGIKLTPPVLTASDGTYENKVRLSWVSSSTVAEGVRIYRDSVLIADLPVFLTPYDDPDVVGLTDYTYCIEAYHGSWGASEWNCDKGKITIKKPVFTSITNGVPNHEDKVVLNWSNPSTVATGYRIYRDNSLLTTINNPATLTFTDQSSITSLQVYKYEIESFSPVFGSSERSIGTGGAKIKPPTNVQATDGTFANKVTVTWADGSSLPGRSFRIYRNGFLIATRPQGTSSFDDFEVNSQSIYQYCVTTFKSGLGESDITLACNEGSTQTTPTSPLPQTSSSTKLVPDVSNAYDLAGKSVGISGSTVVLGAPGNDGKAFVFRGTAGAWEQEKNLPRPIEDSITIFPFPCCPYKIVPPYDYHGFGESVDIDGNRIVVGIPYHSYYPNPYYSGWPFQVGDKLSIQNGAVAAYEFSNGDWTHKHTKKPVDLGPYYSNSYEYLGASVDIQGSWVAIGSPGRVGGGTSYRYDVANNGGLIGASSPYVASTAGTSVRIFNGGSNVLMGDPTSTNGGQGGQVWMSGINGYLQSTTANEYFGWRLALSNNNTVFVGAPNNATGGANAGRVYLSNYGGTGYQSNIQTISPPTPTANDQFGFAVASAGNRVVIGAPGHDSAGPNAGAVFVYQKIRGVWQLAAKLVAPDPGGGYDAFGYSLAMVNNTVVIGAPNDDSDANPLSYDHGSAYVYILPPEDLTASDGAFSNRVKLQWNNAGYNNVADGFRIYRDGELIAEEGLASSIYYDYDAIPGKLTTYCLEVYTNSSSSASYRICDEGFVRPVGRISGEVKSTLQAGVPNIEVCANGNLHQHSLQFSAPVNTAGNSAVAATNINLANSDLSIEFWAKQPSTGNVDRAIFTFGNTGSNVVVGLNPAGRLRFVTNNNAGVIEADTTTTNAAWNHYAVTFRNSDKMTWLYRNGVLVKQGTIASGFTDAAATELCIGSWFNQAAFYNGLIDEVRVWNILLDQTSIQERKNRYLRGDEAGLQAYYAFSEGEGGVAADFAQNMGGHAKISGAFWTYDIPPVKYCATTNAAGYYEINNIFFGEESEFTIMPVKTGHNFNPTFQNRTLTTFNNLANNVNFTDNTVFTIAGKVTLNTPVPCPQDSVLMFVNGVYLGNKTGLDGTYEIAISEPGNYIIEPRVVSGDHVFSPAQINLGFVDGDVTDVDFTNTTVRTISGTVRGACNALIGDVELLVTTDPPCFTYTISPTATPYAFNPANGYFQFQGPPTKYNVRVVKVTQNGQRNLQAENYFLSRSQNTDLRKESADTLDFVYNKPFQLTLADLPTTKTCDGLNYVMAVGEQQPISIEVFQNYNGQLCPADSGILYITDNVSGYGVMQVPFYNGVGYHTLRPDFPEVFSPYLKSFNVVAEVAGALTAPKQIKVLVTGTRPRTSTFLTKFPEEPFMILRRPPGDKSASTITQDTSLCNSRKYAYTTENTIGTDLNFKLGAKFMVGFGYYTQSEIKLNWINLGLELGMAAEGNDEWKTCTKATQQYSTTSDNIVLTGANGNVYAGSGINMIYAVTDVIEYTNCVVDKSQSIAIEPDDFETIFAYTEWHIKNTLTAQYNQIVNIYRQDSINAATAGNAVLAQQKGDSARFYQFQLLNWNNILSLEDSLTNASLQNNSPVNYSFSAGAPFNSSQTVETNSTGSRDFYFLLNAQLAYTAGVEVNGVGLENKVFIKSSSKIGGGTGFENTYTNTSDFTLDDDDVGDFFSVNTAQDKVYGVPVFKLVAGTSSCPWEPGTQKRDNPVLTLEDVPFKDNVPPDDPASFIVTLRNDSESDEGRIYFVNLVQATNPNGASITLGGDNLGFGGGTNYYLGPGQSITTVLSILRGPQEYNYDNIQVYTYPQCEYNVFDAGGSLYIADTVTISAHFQSPCSDITLASPIDNWLVHANSNNQLQLTITNYDTTAIHEVLMEYRSTTAGNEWLPMFVPIPRDTLAKYLDGYYTKMWNVAGLQDGDYEIRARALCQTPTGTAFNSSEMLPGTIDRSFDGLYGEPEPADGVLSQGDLIYVDFSEVMNCLIPTAINPGPEISTLYIDLPNTLSLIDVTTGDTLVYGSNDDYTIGCGGNGGVRLQLNIKPSVLDQVEGHLLQVNVMDAQDIFGNHIGAPISWSFVVQRRVVYWNPPTVNVTLYQGDVTDVPIQLINVSPITRHFNTFVGNPAMLSYTIQGGATSIAGNSYLAANLEVDATQLPHGVTYTDTLTAVVNNIANTAPEFETYCIVNVTVLAKPPVWVVNPYDFEYSMNLVVDLDMDPSPYQIDVSTDVFDKVAAFVNGQIRGVANVEKVFTSNGWKYIAFLDVYSNTAYGDVIEFRLWDANLGIQYSEEGPAFKLASGTQPPGIFFSTGQFTDGSVAGSNNNPVRLHATGRVQCIDLNQGWNWISFNVLGNNMSVNEVLEGLKYSTTGDIIKSQDGFAQYTTGLGWHGSLQTIENEKAYLIKIAAPADVLCLPGEPVDAPMNPLTLSPGWNWIGYTSQTEDLVDNTLNNANFVQGDLIRSQVDGFAGYDGLAWSNGNLQTMEPGKGYKLYVQNPFDLTYPQFAVPSWSVNSRCYQYSMTIVGELSVNLIPSTDPNDRITASVESNSTVCVPPSATQGMEMVSFEPAVNRHLVFFNVYGDSTSIGKPIQFQMYDASEDEIYTLTAAIDPVTEDTLRFEPDAALGTLQVPYVFPFSTCNDLVTASTEVTCAGNDGTATVSADVVCGLRGRPCINPDFLNTDPDGSASSDLSPYATDWEDVRFQFLYTAEELRAAGLTEGTISQLGFNVVQKLSVLPINGFTIKMQCTDLDELPAGQFLPSGWTVFEGNVTTTTGWNMHKLQYTYEWDGVSNIIVGICYHRPSAEFYNDAVAVSSTPYTSALGNYDDGGFTGCEFTQAFYAYGKRPDIRFGICNVRYEWDDPNQQDTPVAVDLTPGTYHVTVSFGNGCELVRTIDVNLIPPLTLSAPAPAALNCFGDSNGTASVVATQGTPPYTYLWSNGQTTENAFGLPAGTHSVTVTDANNCDEVVSVTINQPTEVVFNTVNVVAALCNGSANGSIAVTAAGGTPPYAYAWSSGQTTPSISGLTAGAYTLTITDSHFCAKIQTINVTQPDALLATNSITNLLCNGNGNGTIALTPAGGTPPYSYLWSNGQTGITATGLSGGTYSVTITDANNCNHVMTGLTIFEPAAITANNLQTPILCNGGTGAITLVPAGGTPPYSYLWSNGQTGITATGLSGGTYGVTITDANGCAKTLSIPFAEPSALGALTANTNLLCYGDNDGTATATATGGTPPYNFLWSNGQTTATATQLTAGTYSYTVTDANNCTYSTSVTIGQPPQFQILSGGTNDNEGTGSTPTFYNYNTIQFSGGTQPYSYEWNNAGYVTYTVLSPGLISVIYADGALWSLTVTDANGCGSSELVFSNNTSPGDGELLDIYDYTVSSDNGNGTGAIQLFVNGGTAPYTYQWEGPSGYTGPTTGVGLSTITGLPSGWYIVTVTDSGNPEQATIGWYWVPLQVRGRGKLAADECSLDIYPNPFQYETTIEMNAGTTDIARLDVFNLKGDWIGQIYNGELTAGLPAKIIFTAGNLGDGVYICRMTMRNGTVISEKMVITR
ncbi:hypothetical protein C7N43_21685 [Sphingobacteriales bacterium UPWRP_1]|nr:hypothetical protein B6N25_01260 [Sphingobacteriales bacterium TSM_CSS]PSJ74887.1 hypothetical protein C7N43_21685 [Sphingobacteriales bacterium UPWRP_1]